MKISNARKKSVAVLGGLVVVGTVGASASSLGGLSSDDLGADAVDVQSCDSNGIEVDYSTGWDAASTSWRIEEFVFSGIDQSCHEQTYELYVHDDANEVKFYRSGSVEISFDALGAATSDRLVLDLSELTDEAGDPVYKPTVEEVEHIALAISGGEFTPDPGLLP